MDQPPSYSTVHNTTSRRPSPTYEAPPYAPPHDNSPQISELPVYADVVGPLSPAAPVSPSKAFGRRIFDKMTNTTHERRAAQRQAVAEQERKAVQMHDATQKVYETGKPAFVRRDSRGNDVYLLPPPSLAVDDEPSSAGLSSAAGDPFANPRSVFIKLRDPASKSDGSGYTGPYSVPIGFGSARGLASAGLGGF